MQDHIPLDPYEVRKHLEASLADLAILYDCDPRGFREHLKNHLRQKGIIQRSTTELSAEVMNILADQISKFVYKMTEHTPPNERGVLNFDVIFNTKES